MKQVIFIALVAILLAGCNNSSDSKTASGDSAKNADAKMAAKDAHLDLPYKLDHPYAEWQPGDEQHAATVMKSLKAFENGDINTCMLGFGDSVRVGFDNFQARLSKDSLKASFTVQRGMYSSITIKMEDWESVISADKKDEWVTLWYKEYNTDKKGMTDSLGVVDDCKIVNGKIVVLDEKTQKLGPAKKS